MQFDSRFDNSTVIVWIFSQFAVVPGLGAADFLIGPIKRLVIYQLKKDCKMTKILNMPAMATEGTTVCYTVTHDDLIDFAREIIERTKEMGEAEKAETSASVEDGYYTRKEVMALLKRCDSTMTKWAHAGYLVPVRVGGKHLYRKSDVDKLIGK